MFPANRFLSIFHSLRFRCPLVWVWSTYLRLVRFRFSFSPRDCYLSVPSLSIIDHCRLVCGNASYSFNTNDWLISSCHIITSSLLGHVSSLAVLEFFFYSDYHFRISHHSFYIYCQPRSIYECSSIENNIEYNNEGTFLSSKPLLYSLKIRPLNRGDFFQHQFSWM